MSPTGGVAPAGAEPAMARAEQAMGAAGPPRGMI